MKLISYVAIIVFFITPRSSYSFDKIGHRVCADIAQHLLSDKSQKKINELLGSETMAEASTYVDEMRSNPDEFWQKKSTAFHYVTVPDDTTYLKVGAPKQGDAMTALTHYSTVLLDTKAQHDDQVLALKFIIHIIADLHQPLHVGNGNDRGGNDVKIKNFGHFTNLHHVLDTELIDSQKLSYTEWSDWLRRKISQQEITLWSHSTPLDWIAESKEIRLKIYPKSQKIGWDYQYQNLPIIKKRMEQAGLRIASYLNGLFDKS